MTIGQNQETQQDNPLGETPGGEKGTTPEGTPKTLEEQVAHIKEAAFAEVGRYRVESEKAVKAANAALDRLNRYIKTQEEAEDERYRDDPDKLTELRKERKDRDRATELDKKEQELNEREKGLKPSEEKATEDKAKEVATKYEVDVKTLIKFTDGSPEAMEELAQSLSRKDRRQALKLDSSRTIGGMDWRGLSADEKIRRSIK